MIDFLATTPFVIAFLLFLLFLSLATNTRIVYGFLWLVLVGMVAVNGEKIAAKIKEAKTI